MIGLEIIRGYVNGGFIIPTWEIILYVAVMSFYALMGRTQSCLINSFAFTFYWGFMYLMPKAVAAGGLSHTALMMYVICGLGIYALVTLAFLKHRPKGEKVRCAINGGGFL